VRQLMERKDLDAVSVATMQYWHALPTIWACQTGRHVLCGETAGAFHLGGAADGECSQEHNRLVRWARKAVRSRGMPQWPVGSKRETWEDPVCDLLRQQPRHSVGKPH